MVTQTMNDLMTPKEKDMAKKVGKFYLKLFRNAGLFLLLGLILTGASLVTSDPAGSQVTLESGETAYLHQFFAEAGDRLQFGFGISEINGYEYNYKGENSYYNDYDGEYYAEGIDSPWDLVEYMETMEWYVQLQVEYSESINFETASVITDVSGEINFIDIEVYQDGFYRMKVTNQHSEQLTIGVFKTEANLALIGATIVVWFLFAVTVAILTFCIHLGVWIVFFYILIKALQIIQEDRRRSYPQVIGPQDKVEA